MSRTFAPITIDELEKKITNCDIINEIKKDLKVSFSFENFEQNSALINSGLFGYNTLDNGLTFCGMEACGDWQSPVFFIVYFDGKKLRGYVPTDGNPWNTTTKQAYGNNEGVDIKNAKKRFPKMYENWDYFDVCDFEFDKELILADIKDRIKPTIEEKLSLQKRVEALTFYEANNESGELFQEACHFCYLLNGMNEVEKAEIVYKWANMWAKESRYTAEEIDRDIEKGVWG